MTSSCPSINYVGEVLPIVHTAALLDGTALTDDDVDSVTVGITLGSEVIETETPMTWDETDLHWEFPWDTTGLDPGWYRIQVWITDLIGGRVWDYRTVRLSAAP